MTELFEQRCMACEGGVAPLGEGEIKNYLKDLNDWRVSDDLKSIQKKFHFKTYGKTMGFVNAVAWIAQVEAHHPDLTVTYNSATVLFTTHAIDGLSTNDFICAAKVDRLLP